MNAVLKIDPEFESMCPPLTDEEYEQLKENIIAEGEVLMPLIVWNGVIIDGHNRYKIAQENPKVKYSTRDKAFTNRYEAIAWICKNQLGRRNLTVQQKTYLVGERYEAEKKAHGASDGFRGNQTRKSVSDNSCHLPAETRTRKRIADEVGISQGAVENASRYAKGVNAAEEVLPGIKQEILTGTIKPSQKAVAAVAKAQPEERRQKAEELRLPKEKPQTKPSRKEVRQEMKEIRDIYASMLPSDTPTPANEDYILDTLRGAVTDMIRVCDTLFSDFPRLLADHEYKAKVIEIMQEPKQYILGIEGE
jgi:hypothetical protein